MQLREKKAYCEEGASGENSILTYKTHNKGG